MRDNQRTIFIIDKSLEDRTVYGRFLESNSQYIYKIVEFESGLEAIKCCQQTMPDLILLDFFLPEVSGLEFLEELKLQTGRNLIPVVVLSGQGDETTAVQAMKSGAQDYLVKGRLTSEALNRASHTVMERVRLMLQLEQQQEQQRLIGAIALRIRQSLSLETVLNTAVDEVRNFLKADRVLVYQFHPDMSGTMVAESVLPECKTFLNTRLQDTFFCEHPTPEYPHGEQCVIPNIYEAGFSEFHIQWLEQFQHLAHLIVPIVSCSSTGHPEALRSWLNVNNSDLWGLLIVHQCSAPRQWQQSEIDLLDQLSVQLAIAIQQAELYQNLQTLNVQLEAKVQERTNEIAKRQQIEDELRQSEAKFRQLAENIRRSLEEKEILLKEIHHRVKNNLQIISSLLRMQSRRPLDKATLILFQESQNRVQSMALIHEQLYQSPDLSQIDFGEYIRSLTDKLFRCYGVKQSIALNIETNGLKLILDTAIPCGLMINELVSNSLKYAFPNGDKGEIAISLQLATDNTVTLTVSDNGIGIPETLDWQNSNSLGLRIVSNLTKQLKGNIYLDRAHGTTFQIIFVVNL